MKKPTRYESCQRCGYRLGDGDRYCKRCGSRRGEGEYMPEEHEIQCLYGPPHVFDSREYTCYYVCEECHLKWTRKKTKRSAPDDYCPKCGKKVKRSTDCDTDLYDDFFVQLKH